MAEEEGRYRAPALDKGLDILERLAAAEEGLSQAEIAKSLGRSANEIYRMLDRLVRRGYVLRTAGDRYELTLKLFALGQRHPPTRRLVGQAMPLMRAFAKAAEQACHLAVYDRGRVVVIAQIDAPSYFTYTMRVGAQLGLYSTGSGHVLLAFAPPAERAFMEAEHEDGFEDAAPPEGLAQRLAEVRARGYELMPSAQVEGVQNISVPVLGPEGTVLAALTCPYMRRIDRDDRPDPRRTLALLVEAGRDLSRLSGGTG